jgi:hypothetical protein
MNYDEFFEECCLKIKNEEISLSWFNFNTSDISVVMPGIDFIKCKYPETYSSFFKRFLKVDGFKYQVEQENVVAMMPKFGVENQEIKIINKSVNVHFLVKIKFIDTVSTTTTNDEFIIIKPKQQTCLHFNLLDEMKENKKSVILNSWPWQQENNIPPRISICVWPIGQVQIPKATHETSRRLSVYSPNMISIISLYVEKFYKNYQFNTPIFPKAIWRWKLVRSNMSGSLNAVSDINISSLQLDSIPQGFVIFFVQKDQNPIFQWVPV